MPYSLFKRARLPLFTLLMLVASMALAAPSADAHESPSKWNTRAIVWSSAGTRYTVSYDLAQDNHCARSRMFVSGSWRVKSTDCSHNPVLNPGSVGSQASSGDLSFSSCIRYHEGTTGCDYKTFPASTSAGGSLPPV